MFQTWSCRWWWRSGRGGLAQCSSCGRGSSLLGNDKNSKLKERESVKKTQKCESTKMLTWYSLCEGKRQNSPSASVPMARSCSTWVQTWTMSISSKPNPVKYMNLNWSFANLICHLAKLVNVALVVLHALLRQVQMGRELGKISMNHEFKSNIWR